MYSIVMVAAMTAAPETPDFFCCWKSSCHGCYGGCTGYSCGGCCGGYSCGGCCGGWGYGCGGCHGYASCFGCYGGHACSGCCGGYAMPAGPGMYMAPAAPPGVAPAPPPTKTSAEGPVAINALPSNRGQVVVFAPANAKLFADGQATTLTGAERVFQTPELLAGRDFQYTLKIEYADGTETKSVSKQVLVRAGHRTVVDFTNASESVTSSVTVTLPEKAKLFVDGVETPATGGKHAFKTPELTRGKAYVYSFRAEIERDGKTQVESRNVTFKGGDAVSVDFNEPAAIRTASR